MLISDVPEIRDAGFTYGDYAWECHGPDDEIQGNCRAVVVVLSGFKWHGMRESLTKRQQKWKALLNPDFAEYYRLMFL